MADNDRLRRALLRLSEAALEAVNSLEEDREADEDEEDGVEAVDRPSEAVSQAVCVPKKLSNSVLLKASKTAATRMAPRAWGLRRSSTFRLLGS